MSKKQQMILDATAKITIIGGAAGCVDSDTEFLTSEGWVRFSEYKEGNKVAEYCPFSDTIKFSTPLEYIKLPCKELTLLKGKGMEMCLSDEHTVLYWNDGFKTHKTLPFSEVKNRHESSKTKGWTGKIKTTYKVDCKGLDISEGELRLQVAVMADGRVVKGGKDNYTQMRFAKKRKYERLLTLCKKYGLRYDDRGWKPCGRYKSGKLYEVIVWPKWADKNYSNKYYLCNQNQLEIIADECIHWDGSPQAYGKRCSYRYYSKYKTDADFIQHVFASCGMNTSLVFDKKESGFDGSLGYWTVNGNCSGKGYRSFANKDKKNPLTPYKTTDGYKYCFTTNTGFFLARRNNKVFLTGNSGKSHLLQMLPLQIVDDPRTACIMFRRTTPQLNGQGGLVDKARGIYNQLPTEWRPRFTKNPHKADFPNGATVQWSHMQHVTDKENIQGLEYTLIGVDEGTQFEWEQIDYMISRLRSASKYPSRLVVSCNPEYGSWIHDLIKDFYLDEEGYAIPERDGVVRYFVKEGQDFHWGDTKKELQGKFNIADNDAEEEIMSFTFISATIHDNPVMLKTNRDYLASLKALDPVERARLLDGCWEAIPEGSSYFKRKWLRGENGERVKGVSDIPQGCTAFRAVDCAHNEPHEGNLDPDYTAFSPLVLKDKDGFYWLLGNYSEALLDKPAKKSDKPVIGRIRRLAGERNNLIVKQAKLDKDLQKTYKYTTPQLVLAKDNGAGASDFMSLYNRLIEEGIKVNQDASPSNVKGKKLKDFLGFSEAAQNGSVYIVEETFEPSTLDAIYREWERFDGEKSTRTKKDDWCDSTSMSFNACRDAKRPYKTLIRNQRVVDTLSARLYK